MARGPAVAKHVEVLANALDTEIIKTAQINSRNKTVQRAKKRKERSEKKQKDNNSETEPPKKKRKINSRIIAFNKEPEVIRVLSELFFSTKIYSPALNKLGIYIGAENTTTFHHFYPVCLCDTNGTKEKPRSYLIGVTRPPVIFTILRHAFDILYGDKPEYKGRHDEWDIYRWNKKYYGSKIEKQSKNFIVLASELAQTRPYGGSEVGSSVHWTEECKTTGKFNKGISVEEGLSKPVSWASPPAFAEVYPSTYLAELLKAVNELNEKENEAKQEATAMLETKETKELVLQLDNEDNSDTDGSSSED